MDNKDFREKSADVAKNFIHKWYDKSATVKELLELADPQGFSWIGYMAPEFNRTEAEARDYYIKKQARKEIPMMKVDGDRYDTQIIGENACLVLCECHVYVPQEYKLVISEVQRVTMLMRRDGEHIFITHIHASNPWFAVGKDEKFAITAGRANYEYARTLLAMERFKTDVDLTRRQKQILSELCDGKTYKEIGETLDISPRTVCYHVEELMHHFHVENRYQLLARARSQPRSKK